jgi:hypothetical protein
MLDFQGISPEKGEEMNNRTSKSGRALVSLALFIVASIAVIPSSTAANLPSARLVSPAYNAANSVDATGDISQYYSPGTKAFYTYIGHGTKLSLTYLVTSDGTTPAFNQEVRLQINAPYSGSKANWVTADGTKVTAQDGGNFGLELIGKTDSMGKVTFEVTNTDTTGLEEIPTSPIQDRGAIKPARLYGTMKVVIPGKGDKDADTDLVTFDITKAPAAVLPAPSTPSATPSATPSTTATPIATPPATATPTPTQTETPVVTSALITKQTISSVATSLKVGNSINLPAKSSAGISIKWVSTTKSTCTVSGSKVTAKKKGSCSVTGTNAGDAKNAALSVIKKITVK